MSYDAIRGWGTDGVVSPMSAKHVQPRVWTPAAASHARIHSSARSVPVRPVRAHGCERIYSKRLGLDGRPSRTGTAPGDAPRNTCTGGTHIMGPPKAMAGIRRPPAASHPRYCVYDVPR